MNEEQRKVLDDLLSKGEMAMRDRGLGDAEIVEKKRQVREMIEQRPPNEPQWDVPGQLDAGRPPQEVLPSLGKDGWLVELASHRILVRLGLVVLCGVVGYFGAWGRGNDTQPLPTGLPGLLFGLGVGIAVVGFVEFSLRAQRRRRSR